MVSMKNGITFVFLMVILAAFPLAACSPRVVTTETATPTIPVVSIDWSPDINCKNCHTVEAASFSEEMVASVHTVQACVSCHNDVNVLSEVHVGVTTADNPPAKLSTAAKISDELCDSCHDLESRSQATLGSTILTDNNGTIVNPHLLPESHQGQKVSCIDCHVMHKTNDIAKSAQNTCISCHHENVYQCGTCHE